MFISFRNGAYKTFKAVREDTSTLKKYSLVIAKILVLLQYIIRTSSVEADHWNDACFEILKGRYKGLQYSELDALMGPIPSDDIDENENERAKTTTKPDIESFTKAIIEMISEEESDTISSNLIVFIVGLIYYDSEESDSYMWENIRTASSSLQYFIRYCLAFHVSAENSRKRYIYIYIF